MNKEDKQGYAIIIVLIAVLGLIIWLMINYTTQKEKNYEYALNQEIGVSNKCYYSDDAYCEVDNKVIKVDCYYEVEK